MGALVEETISSNAMIDVQGLETTFHSRQGSYPVVRKISYQIEAGELLGIVGESGCGKSVTSSSLMRLIETPGEITAGKILYKGKNLLDLSSGEMEKIRGKEIAMIFQEPMTALNPVMTIGSQIAEQLKKHTGASKNEAREKAVDMLHLVGIPSPRERARAFPHELSGGMRQRAMIAMALSCEPSFLIADEPTTALDVTIQAQILELLQELQQKFRMTIQFISHDLAMISEISDRVMVMYGGDICEIAPADEVFRNSIHPYTRLLLQARPRAGNPGQKLSTIEGSVPSPWQMGPGCSFFSRCPQANSKCQESKPELREIQAKHYVACFQARVG